MYHYVLPIKIVQVVSSNTRLDNLLDLVQNLPGDLTRLLDLDDLHRAPDHLCPRYEPPVEISEIIQYTDPSQHKHCIGIITLINFIAFKKQYK